MLKSQNKTLSLIHNCDEISLTKSHFLIGSSTAIELSLDHDSVSPYHALIIYNQEGEYLIQDLSSLNGTFLNGARIDSVVTLTEGDQITIGKIHLNLIESSIQPKKQDHLSTTVDYNQQNEEFIFVPKKENEDQVLIDGEYCDIVFDQTEYKPESSQFSFDFSEYISPEEIDSESFEIEKENEDLCLQVTTSLNNIILEQYYYELKDQVILGSSKNKKNHVFIESLEGFQAPIAEIKNSLIALKDIESFHSSTKSGVIENGLNINQTHGLYNISYSLAKKPNTIIDLSSIRREKGFYKKSAKEFAIAIVPLLLLLFIDFTLPKKEKELTIIYKKPVKTNINEKEITSQEVAKTDKNDGHKKEKQPDKKIARNTKGQKQKPKKKTPQPKVAKATNTKPVKSKTKAKVKAYKFKFASNVKSMFSKTTKLNVKKSRSIASTNSQSAFNSSNLDTKATARNSKNIGNLGSDTSGQLNSYGSKGLSSRKGRDSAYIQTKTVVLGSMDPELLRKILQQYLPQFRHCYQQELVYHSEKIKGVVDLNFEISGGGKVGKIKIKTKSSKFSRKGVNCMAKVLNLINFPKPKGGGRVAVRQPLNFFSEQEKS